MANVGLVDPVAPQEVKVHVVKLYESAAFAGSAVKFAPATAVSRVAPTTKALRRLFLIVLENFGSFICGVTGVFRPFRSVAIWQC